MSAVDGAFDRSVDDFADYLRFERRSSVNTLAAYGRALRKWGDWCEIRSFDPLSPDDETTAAFVAWLRETGAASSSAQQIMAALRSWVRYRRVAGLAAAADLKLPTLPDKPQILPQVLTDGEVDRLLAACDGPNWNDLRDRAMIQVLADCGLRASEVCGLTPGSIDFESRFLHVRGKGDKDRTVPFGEAVWKALRAWLDARAGKWGDLPRRPAFLSRSGDPLTRIDLWRIVRTRGSTAGIAKARLHPHVLRHSVATRLLRRGMDLRTLQEFLGHSSIGTTEKYTHFDLELRDVYDRCHPHARLTETKEDSAE